MVTRLRIWAACGLASVLAAGTALGDGKGDGKSIIIARTETDCLLTSSRRTAEPSSSCSGCDEGDYAFRSGCKPCPASAAAGTGEARAAPAAAR